MDTTGTPAVTPSEASETAERERDQESSRPPGAHGKDGKGDSDGRSEPYEEEPESPA